VLAVRASPLLEVYTKINIMKFSFLKKIVTEYAEQLKEDAGYSGSHTDGGCSSILTNLSKYQDSLVVKMDLRPSEFSKLNDVEVGEPVEFSNIIEKYKIKLAKEIQL
jgi:hypothetical protein